ncbi:probable phosphoglycerate mutase Pmu1p [Diutina catenulata]
MKSKPTALDVLDAQLGPEDAAHYHAKLAELNQQRPHHWHFSVVPNQFAQSSGDTDDTSFNYLTSQMGVVGGWQRAVAELDRLNAESDANTVYKMLYLARHGQGHHNVAHLHYGDELWNEKYSKIDGADGKVWGPDPELTELGVAQAVENGLGWQQAVAEVPEMAPQRLFVSPLRRSVDTMVHTWQNIVDFAQVRPVIRENLREQIGVHTCDKRSPRRVIAAKYEPLGIAIEPGFAEEDELFSYDVREPSSDQAVRMHSAFTDIFDELTKDESIVAVTTHSGAMRTQLLVLGHRPFAVGTGGLIPVFVKAEKVTRPDQ